MSEKFSRMCGCALLHTIYIMFEPQYFDYFLARIIIIFKSFILESLNEPVGRLCAEHVCGTLTKMTVN